MKRDNVTFALQHDAHVRDFQMFVAAVAARQPAKRRSYANRRLAAALI
jgi:hypothetical protein